MRHLKLLPWLRLMSPSLSPSYLCIICTDMGVIWSWWRHLTYRSIFDDDCSQQAPNLLLHPYEHFHLWAWSSTQSPKDVMTGFTDEIRARYPLYTFYTYSYFVTRRWGKQMENLSNSLRRFKTWRNLFFHGHLRCVWHEWKYRLTAQICAYCTSKPEDGATHPTDFLSLHNLWLMDSGGKQQSTFTQVLRCGTILSYFFLSILEYLDSILWFYIVLFILHLFESCTISYCADTCKGVFLHCHTAIFT